MAEDIARHLGFLSGSSGGRLLKISATATPGTLVHTTGSGSEVFEKLWIKASNEHTAAVTVTVEWGGTSSDDRWSFVLDPSSSPIEIVSADVLGPSKEVRIYASVANVVYVLGEAIEVTNTV